MRKVITYVLQVPKIEKRRISHKKNKLSVPLGDDNFNPIAFNFIRPTGHLEKEESFQANGYSTPEMKRALHPRSETENTNKEPEKSSGYALLPLPIASTVCCAATAGQLTKSLKRQTHF